MTTTTTTMMMNFKAQKAVPEVDIIYNVTFLRSQSYPLASL